MEAKLNNELQLFGKMPLDIQDTSDTAFKETTPEIWKTSKIRHYNNRYSIKFSLFGKEDKIVCSKNQNKYISTEYTKITE